MQGLMINSMIQNVSLKNVILLVQSNVDILIYHRFNSHLTGNYLTSDCH